MFVICIPTYRTELEWYESVSLQQVFSIFGERHDICFCVPESISDYYVEEYGNRALVRSFPDEYFTSVRAYSELCLSPFFYECFDSYEYMLLYQLDAFVFSDKLSYFCNLGYDYIGADACDGSDWNRINESVGCGGFSLRKVSSAIRILKEHSDLLRDHPFREIFITKEDVFWGYCGHISNIDFKIPNIDVANEFAVTFGTDYLVDKKDLQALPFGTHAWHRYDFDLWKPIIEQLGYTLPKIEEIIFSRTDDTFTRAREYRTILNGLKSHGSSIDDTKSCSIWGAGYNGIRCIRVLNLIGMRISHVYDWNRSALDGVVDIVAPDVENPTICNLEKMDRDELLIITTKTDAEIRGKTGKRKYILYEDFLSSISKKYCL